MNDLTRIALRRKLARAEAAGDKARAKQLRERIGEDDAVQDEADNSNEEVGLDAVLFASPAARKAAEDAGLDAESFKRRRKSSDAGFTKADVERIAGTNEDHEEGA